MKTNIETVKQTKHKLKGESMETNMTTVEQPEISEEEMNNPMETAFSEINDPLYLKEFLSVNSLLLKKSLSDNYEQLALEYSYRSSADQITYIEDVVDEFFFVEKIDMYQLRKIKRSIVRIFKDHMELFFSQMKTEILSLKFQSMNDKEHLIKRYEYVWSSIGGYREYLGTKDVDRHTKLLLTYKYLPPNIQREIDDHELDKGIRLKGVIEVLISRIKYPGYKEKALD
jgi:hypothetical protein